MTAPSPTFTKSPVEITIEDGQKPVQMWVYLTPGHRVSAVSVDGLCGNVGSGLCLALVVIYRSYEVRGMADQCADDFSVNPLTYAILDGIHRTVSAVRAALKGVHG